MPNAQQFYSIAVEVRDNSTETPRRRFRAGDHTYSHLAQSLDGRVDVLHRKADAQYAALRGIRRWIDLENDGIHFTCIVLRPTAMPVSNKAKAERLVETHGLFYIRRVENDEV